MRVQEAVRRDGSRVWLLVDEEYRPIDPVMRYLRYLESVQRSPNTLRAYAMDLKLYWEFLEYLVLDWREVSLEHLSEFALSLRSRSPKIVLLREATSVRTEKTINRILGTVGSFYEFHERTFIGNEFGLTEERRQLFRRYKGFLHHAGNGLSRKRVLKVKETRTFPGCLSKEDVNKLVGACRSLQEKFLVCLLYESGLRIGEALALRHEDMESSGKNVVRVFPRHNEHASSRSKSQVERRVDVSMELMRLYSQYLIDEYPLDGQSDYIFVKRSKTNRSVLEPLTYSHVHGVFRRLRRRSGVDVTPHLLRHTHATGLIRAGWNPAYVQKRLGHAHVQTTINTYIHLTREDLNEAYGDYLREQKTDTRTNAAKVND